MNLNKVKKDISKMKNEMGLGKEPTMHNFFRYCEKYYGRPVDCGELLFSTYNRHGRTFKSNKMLFLRLSEEYFTKLHNVRNPIKEGQHGLKWLYTTYWAEKINKDDSIYLDKVYMNPEFNKWFEGVWNELKQEFDKIDIENLPGAEL